MLTVLDEDEAMFRQYALPEEVVRVRYPSREPGVWRWFRSANVVDLYRYRDGAELERIGRLLRRAAVIGNGNPNSDFLDQAFGPGRLITQCGTVRNHQARIHSSVSGPLLEERVKFAATRFLAAKFPTSIRRRLQLPCNTASRNADAIRLSGVSP